MTPWVSVIVPTFNRLDRLDRVLAALLNQDVGDVGVEIVVVSDGSTDGTNERLGSTDDPRIVAICQDNAGPAAARNAGIEVAQGQLVVFIDDDVVPEPDCLAAHIAAHASGSDPKVVIGPLLTADEDALSPWVRWEQRMLYKQYDALNNGIYGATARQFYTGNASIEREHLVAAGGFDPAFLRAEDVELGYRLADAGLTFVFEANARAHHYAERSYDGWRNIAEAYGRNDVRFWRDGGRDWLIPQIRAEFDERHVLSRTFTRLAVRVPVLGRVVSAVAPVVITAGTRLGRPAAGQSLLSAVYGMHYCKGLAAEIGGFDAFLAVEPPEWARDRR